MGPVAWRRPTVLWVAAALLTLTVPVAAVAADDPGDPTANAPAPVVSPVRPAAGATSPQARREQARERAFEQIEDATVPMTPEQLQSLIQSLDTAEAVSSAHRPPETVMTAEALDLNATRPPVVRVGQGYGASLLFTDRTGKAWPITAYQGFNDQLFVVSASTLTGDKDDLPSVLVVQPVASRGAGNLVVTLKGLETPIVLTLALGQNTLDARKEFKLPLAGPNAAPEYRAPSPRGIETALLNVLNGLPPTTSATRVEVRGVEPEALAWRVGKALYLRTVAEVYSPEYRQRASHPSGLHAYQLPDVPVLLVSFNGHLTELTLQE